MIALGTGATMLGATLMSGVLAADLADYPTQYIQDGVFNGLLVVGDQAAAQDVVGITDIAISLQHGSVKPVESGGSTVAASGDAWKVGTSTKILELSENLNTGVNVETIRNITTFIDANELDILASGTVNNNKAASPYNQYLYLMGPGTGVASGFVQFIEENNDDGVDTTADYLYFKTGTEIARYLIEFTTALESDVDDSTGSSDATGLFLTDYEDVDIEFMGKPYTIVTAKRTSTTARAVKLTLMGGATKDTLLEKATKTYNIGGKDYETTINFVDADEAQFTVNGVASRKLKDGDTDKLFTGTDSEITVGVTDILYQDYAGGIHSTTFFIGAQKLELTDSDITDVGSSNSLKFGDNTIDDASVIIEGTDDNSTFKITRIHVNMTADDDYWVPAGGKLSENPDLAEPEVLFTNNWDIEYRGLADQPIENIELSTSGSKRYKLKFKDGNGDEVSLPIAEAIAASQLVIGEKDKPFINQENKTIRKNAYFVLTDSTENRGERKSYILQYKGADKLGADSPVLKFKNLGSGETIEQTYGNTSSSVVGTDWGGGAELATLKLGGSDYRIYGSGDVSANDFNIIADLDASGAIVANSDQTAQQFSRLNTINITTFYGMEIGVENASGNSINISFKTPDNTRDGSGTQDNVETLQATDFGVDISSDSNGKVDFAETAGMTGGQTQAGTAIRMNAITPDGETDVSYGYTSYGTFISQETPSSDPNTLKIEYPKKQREALVYFTSSGTSFTSTAATGEAGVSQRIEVGAVRLASEVTDIQAQNTILVGGPCANTAAAAVMGVATSFPECAADFKPNTAKINLYEHTNGNVAILVAGNSAADTRVATGVLADYGLNQADLVGTELEVTKVQNAVVVAAPVMEATPPAPPAADPDPAPTE